MHCWNKVGSQNSTGCLTLLETTGNLPEIIRTDLLDALF